MDSVPAFYNQDLYNTTGTNVQLIDAAQVNTSTLNVSGAANFSYLNPYAVLETDASKNIIGVNLTNNQVLLGATGSAPVPTLATNASTPFTVALRDASGNIHFAKTYTNIIAPDSTFSVSVDADLLPFTDSAFALGQSFAKWASAYINTVNATTVNCTTLSLTTIDTDNLNAKTGVNIAVGSSLNPSADITYSLGNSSHNWLNVYSHNVNCTNVNTNNTFTDSLGANSGSTISLTNSIIPNVNNTLALGNSSNTFASAEIGNIWSPQVGTRSGSLLLLPANNSIQANANIWISQSYTGGVFTNNFAQNFFAGQDYSIYFGHFSDTLQRGTIQAYHQSAFTGIPLVLQPNTGSQSRVVIGNYDTNAQGSLKTLYVNGDAFTASAMTTGGLFTANAGATLSGTCTISNRNIIFGSSSPAITLAVATPASSRTVTLQDPGASADILTTAGAQNCNTDIKKIPNMLITTINSSTGDTLTIGNNGTPHKTTFIGDIDALTANLNLNTTGSANCNIGNLVGACVNTIKGTNSLTGTTTINTTGSATTSIGVAGVSTTIQGAGVKFLNNVTSSTPTEMNVYEEYTHTSVINGPWAVGSNPTFTMKVVRTNNTVRLAFYSFAATATTPAVMRTVTNLPARFRPTTSTFVDTILVQSNSVKQFGYIEVLTTGEIDWNAGPVTTSFAGAGTASILGHTITWDIS